MPVLIAGRHGVPRLVRIIRNEGFCFARDDRVEGVAAIQMETGSEVEEAVEGGETTA